MSEAPRNRDYVYGEALYYYLNLIFIFSPFLAFYLASEDHHLLSFEFLAALGFHLVFFVLLQMLKRGREKARWIFISSMIVYLLILLVGPFAWPNFGLGRISYYHAEFELAAIFYFTDKQGFMPVFKSFMKIFVVVIEPLHVLISTLMVTLFYRVMAHYFKVKYSLKAT